MNKVQINTVCGPISPDELGITLMHEHIVYGPPGWEGDQTIAPFNRESIVKAGVEQMKRIKAFGVKTFVDVTTLDSGRAPELYREISEKSEINIICATGYLSEEKGSSTYWKIRGMLGDICEELHELFSTEILKGICDSDIRAGVMKVGSSKGAITDYEKMMFKAAARVQKETGVPIITHTEEGTMGPEQAALLIKEGADPAKIQIGHMSDNLDMQYQMKTFDHNVYVAWDRMGLQIVGGCPMDEQRYPVIVDLINKGYANRLIISHDSIAHWLGRPLNVPEDALPIIANWHPAHLFENIIPELKKRGVTHETIKNIIEDNPKKLFAGKLN